MTMPAPGGRMHCAKVAASTPERLNARDAVKALIKATGLNLHLSVCGWPFCLSDLDDANAEGGAA